MQRSFPNETVPLDNTTVSADGQSSVNFPGLSFIDVDDEVCCNVPAYEKQKTKVEKKAFSSIENIECGPKKRLFTREVDSPTKSLQLESCDVNNSKTLFYENLGPIFLETRLTQPNQTFATSQSDGIFLQNECHFEEKSCQFCFVCRTLTEW